MSQSTMLGQKLFVDVVRATGLAHMNHFTGDHPYVQCEVKHSDHHEQTTKAATKPVTVGDTLNPVWNERLEIQPWQPGEDLEFTVYDKGLIGAKTEGKVTLPSNSFYPQGFNGTLPISGLPNAQLQIAVQPTGGATSTYGASTGITYAAATAAPAVTSAYGATSTYGASSGAVTYSSPITYSAGTSAAYSTAAAPVTYSTSTQQAAAAPVTYSVGTPTAAAAPVITTMSPSTTYTQSSAMPVQTYSSGAAATTFSASTPTISTTQAMPVQTQTYAAPMQTYASPPSPTYVQQPQTYMVQGGQAYAAGATFGTGAYKLAVSVIQAQGLKHMNSFTGDHPYVVCEVKHAAHRAGKTKVETKPVKEGDTLNPVWNETHDLEPWHPGEPLTFTIYDKGLLGSKTEGTVTLPGELFFSNPMGFSGALPISGLSQALLTVAVRVLGPSAVNVEANSGLLDTTTTAAEETIMTQGGIAELLPAKSKKRSKSKKVKVNSKKKSGCC
mmetsp:Transcript_591/g.1180  ORF Transcript_591/g.1180 Transcript_591/m.1180 type:complete len:498 (-) Transcript_591:214-1707(-)